MKNYGIAEDYHLLENSNYLHFFSISILIFLKKKIIHDKSKNNSFTYQNSLEIIKFYLYGSVKQIEFCNLRDYIFGREQRKRMCHFNF